MHFPIFLTFTFLSVLGNMIRARYTGTNLHRLNEVIPMSPGLNTRPQEQLANVPTPELIEPSHRPKQQRPGA